MKLNLLLIALCLMLTGCVPMGSRMETPKPASADLQATYGHLVGRTFYCDPKGTNCPTCVVKTLAELGHTTSCERFTLTGLVSYKGAAYFEATMPHFELLIAVKSIDETRLYVHDARTRRQLAEEANLKALQDVVTQRGPDVLAAVAAAKLNPGDVFYTRERKDGIPGLSKVTYRTAKIVPSKLDTASTFDPEMSPIILVFELPSGATFDRAMGCTLSQPCDPKQLHTMLDSMFYRTLPKWPASLIKDINNGVVVRGMTEQQLAASLGWPKASNRTSGSWGTHDQWIYGEGRYRSYVYLRNGRVSSWQN